MPDIAMKPNRRLLLFLPLAHVFARYMQFFCFAGNVTLGLSSNLKTILADFSAVQAHLHPGRAEDLREDLQRRLAEGRTRAQGAHLRRRRGGGP